MPLFECRGFVFGKTKKLPFSVFDLLDAEDPPNAGGGASFSLGHSNALMVPMDADSSSKRSSSNSPPAHEGQKGPSSGIVSRGASGKRARRSGGNAQAMTNLGMLMGPGGMNMQLPQLDGIQRSQKILDMRLQSLQVGCL
ncbi:hypothetical protein Ciccas_012515 [Cichlidogyrus casuarinus]|uniref:Uncharacterized protein n=1 Tax=Cichlidogyrus casuarinus TaxID=1844966 RepID=A0ABD2PN53_9PLAT